MPWIFEPTADGWDTLYSPAHGQTYHSRYGALTEARHVFLEGTGVARCLRTGRPVTLLEIGFGTGLNFLVTALEALAHRTALHYTALERALPPISVLERLNHRSLLTAGDALHSPAVDPAAAFFTWRRTLPELVPPGVYRLEDGLVTLDLRIGDAATRSLPPGTYEAVYQDAFSPDVNPELWTEAFFSRIFTATRPGARLATYSVRRSVRAALAAAGFTVEKRPGPPGKREMLIAVHP